MIASALHTRPPLPFPTACPSWFWPLEVRHFHASSWLDVLAREHPHIGLRCHQCHLLILPLQEWTLQYLVPCPFQVNLAGRGTRHGNPSRAFLGEARRLILYYVPTIPSPPPKRPYLTFAVFSCYPTYMLVEPLRPSLQAIAYSRSLSIIQRHCVWLHLLACMGFGTSAHGGPQAPEQNKVREPRASSARLAGHGRPGRRRAGREGGGGSSAHVTGT